MAENLVGDSAREVIFMSQKMVSKGAAGRIELNIGCKEVGTFGQESSRPNALTFEREVGVGGVE